MKILIKDTRHAVRNRESVLDISDFLADLSDEELLLIAGGGSVGGAVVGGLHAPVLI
ncbi:hypothetical protein [Caballeronia sp. LZ034LL]|uniref:hypothetical protein n=1 Tax=Caballeronia sp. LZ034LL TaxID=3038567 RepID=UPI00285974EC|nr:hypothetical protein [Caballeronia sp. LZ034LL]MDR5837499.1 hypothetical protein [Caballeronia sp. LZ034LL]